MNLTLIQKKIYSHTNVVNKTFNTQTLKLITYAIETLKKTLENDGTIFTCGNGGSSAEADHMIGELVGRYKKNLT